MKLNPENNTSHNDYINASYVDVSHVHVHAVSDALIN